MTSKEALDNLVGIQLLDYSELFLDKYQEEFNIINSDLDRLEKIDNLLNSHCGKCKNKEGKICVGMNAPISIETLIDCKEMMIYDCNVTIKENLDRLEKIEKEFTKLAKMGMSKIYFQNSKTVILGFNITKDEEEKYNQMVKESFEKILSEYEDYKRKNRQ